jgi:alanine racemase
VITIYQINYNKIKDNILELCKNDYLVLKSNAYGFGFKKVLAIAYSCGMKKICIINIEDAIYIKEKYQDVKVLLLGPLNKKHLNLYEKYQIEITITCNDDFILIEKYNIPYQVEINSGMNRFGVNDINVDFLINDERFKGIYSHNATNDINHINNQLQTFFNICKNIINKDIHFASSSTKELKIPFTTSRRIGCEIYKDSLCIFGKIIQINLCKKGNYLGYDYTYKIDRDCYVGVIDLGYADGLERNCEGFLVCINGRYFPLVGRACMNHSFVLIYDNISIGAEVIFIGINNKLDNYLEFFKKIPHEVYLSYLKKY